MTIAQLSVELLRLSSPNSGLSFQPYAPGTLVSTDVDVAVTNVDGGFAVEVAEPPPGRPVLTDVAVVDDVRQRECQFLIDAIDQRRATLLAVTKAVIASQPMFPHCGHGVKMARIASACDCHVTTVARALDSKTCDTPAGRVLLKSYVFGFGPARG